MIWKSHPLKVTTANRLSYYNSQHRILKNLRLSLLSTRWASVLRLVFAFSNLRH